MLQAVNIGKLDFDGKWLMVFARPSTFHEIQSSAIAVSGELRDGTRQPANLFAVTVLAHYLGSGLDRVATDWPFRASS